MRMVSQRAGPGVQDTQDAHQAAHIMVSQRFLHSRWQHRSPILLALTFPEQQEQHLVAGEVHVFDSESQALQQAQAGTR